MRSYTLLLPIFTLLASEGAADAFAQTLNCNRDFAQIGDSRSTIEMKCGAPAARDNFCRRYDAEPRAGSRGIQVDRCEQIEEWTYRPGSGQFLTMLIFRAGVLESIRYGPRIP